MAKIVVIGGGAAGMACAVFLARKGNHVTVAERGDRLGRKLSATGNGQGNVTNTAADGSHYFSDDPAKVERALARFSPKDCVRFLQSLGGVFMPDARGRVYPAGRQASAVTDLFRRELSRLGADICLGEQVKELSYDRSFRVVTANGQMRADAVVLAAGGKASPNFGTDGTAYALAEAFGHTVTPLSPALVRLKTQPELVRGLKGIRIDCALRLLRAGRELFSGRGDLLFTDGGLSGDLIFRASSYAEKGDVLLLDFVPDADEEALARALARGEGADRLLCVVPNGLGRALYRREQDPIKLASLLKAFPLPVTGNFGFSEAQVTKGGIPLAETDENLQSVFRRGLFFAGEILNVDGECGGYNLQWAFASAYLAAEGVSQC